MVMKMEEQKGVTWDLQKTKTFYETQNELCTCGYCRNFYLTIHKFYPALSDYLAKYGLSIEKPVEAVHLYRDEDGIMHYHTWYAVIRHARGRKGGILCRKH